MKKALRAEMVLVTFGVCSVVLILLIVGLVGYMKQKAATAARSGTVEPRGMSGATR